MMLCVALLSPAIARNASAFSEKRQEVTKPTPTPVPDEGDEDEEEPTIVHGPCDQVIHAADKAIESCQAANAAKAAVIVAQDRSIEILLKQRQEAIDAIDVKGSTPFWLWLVVGVAAGVVLEGARR